MARKPLAGTVAANVLEHGTGALNVDGCRVTGEPSPSVERRKHAAPGVSVGATGWTTTARPDSYNDQRAGESLGRWPANLIHDGSDEVVGLFPETTSGALNRANITAENGIYGKAPKERTGEYAPDTGSAARFFYTAKATKAERQGVTHPTVKPLDLMAYLCRLVTPPGGTVLDPFMGSGTTIKAAIGEGFNAIGIERDPAYFAMAEHRMNGAQLGLALKTPP
jgi:site-specific DNA-methyltransferase (adenine-specific)